MGVISAGETGSLSALRMNESANPRDNNFVHVTENAGNHCYCLFSD
jgi:hypothetical protein